MNALSYKGSALTALVWLPSVLSAGVLSDKVPMETEKPAYKEPWNRYSSWPADD